MGMTLTQMRTDIRYQLKDGSTLWSDLELASCVQRAVADVSRFLPRQRVYESALSFTVSGEPWTAAIAFGTLVSLGFAPIKPESETVLDDQGATMTRDTDYAIDYMNGTLTHISGGDIGNNEICSISYTKSELGISLSSLTGLIRIEKVYYPVGQVPQSDNIGTDLWDDILWIRDTGDESQSRMSATRRIAVRYLAEHTAPTASVAGTTPGVLDWSVIVAACAYACFIKAAQYEHQAITDAGTVALFLGDANLALNFISDTGTPAAAAIAITTALDAAAVELGKVNAALDKMDNAPGPNLTDANTALDAAVSGNALGAVNGALVKVATYLENNSNEDAKYWMTKITGDINSLRTSVGTALDNAATYIGEVDTTDLQGAEAVWADEEMHVRENIKAGAATSTTAFKLVDTNAAFVAGDIGKIVHNLTDDTYAYILVMDSSTIVSISADIMVSAEKYSIFHGSIQALMAEAVRLVNSITTGKDVPERFLQLAQIAQSQQMAYAQKRQDWINQASVRTNAGMAYAQEAMQRIDNLRSYIEQAGGWAQIANGFVNEAGARIGLSNAYAVEAQGRISIALSWIQEAGERTNAAMGYIAEAQQRATLCGVYIQEGVTRLSIAAHTQQQIAADLAIAEQWRQEGIDRRNEAWSIWADPKNYIGQFTFTSVRQPASMSRYE